MKLIKRSITFHKMQKFLSTHLVKKFLKKNERLLHVNKCEESLTNKQSKQRLCISVSKETDNVCIDSKVIHKKCKLLSKGKYRI